MKVSLYLKQVFPHFYYIVWRLWNFKVCTLLVLIHLSDLFLSLMYLCNTIWGPIQKTATAPVNTNQHLFQCSCIFFISALWLYFTICTYIYICIVLATLETKCTPWNFIISRQRNTKSGKFASVTQHPMYFLVQKSVASFILLSFFVELRVEPGSVYSVWIAFNFTENTENTENTKNTEILN